MQFFGVDVGGFTSLYIKAIKKYHIHLPSKLRSPENTSSGWWLQPFWKIWASIGMIIPNIWENRKCSKPPTSHSMVNPYQFSRMADLLGPAPRCTLTDLGRLPGRLFEVGKLLKTPKVVLLPSFYKTVLNILQSSINAMSMLQRYNFKGTGAWLDPQHCVSPGRRLPRFLFTTSRLVWPFSGNVKNVLPAQSTRGARTHPKVAEWIRLISIVFNYC